MRELFQIPLLGQAMRMTLIEVDRDSPDFREIYTDAARALAAGRSLLAFPEGRIPPGGSTRQFKDGAFINRSRTPAPIVPLAICGTRQIWP